MNERIKELAIEHGFIHQNMTAGEKSDALRKFEKITMVVVNECASICYNSNLEDSDLHAQNLLYEFNIDDARNQK